MYLARDEREEEKEDKQSIFVSWIYRAKDMFEVHPSNYLICFTEKKRSKFIFVLSSNVSCCT